MMASVKPRRNTAEKSMGPVCAVCRIVVHVEEVRRDLRARCHKVLAVPDPEEYGRWVLTAPEG